MVKREGLVRDVVGEGCPGLSNYKIRVFHSQRSKERGQQKGPLDFWRAEFGQFRNLAKKVVWEAVLISQGVQEG